MTGVREVKDRETKLGKRGRMMDGVKKKKIKYKVEERNDRRRISEEEQKGMREAN